MMEWRRPHIPSSSCGSCDVLTSPHVELRASPDGGAGGLGAYARSAAAVGDVLIRVPLSGCLTLASPQLREAEGTMRALEALELARSSPQCKLAAIVAAELARSSSTFAPWLERWPRETEGSLGWSADGTEWTRLAAGLGERGVRALHEQHLAMATRAWEGVLEPLAGRADAAGLGALTWERWTYSLSMVLSRALDLRANDESQLAIVPLIDMLNHTAAETDSCHVRYDPGSRSFELVASAPICAGDELRICYGPKSNAELLACYGFALGENGADRLSLSLPFGLPDEPQMVTMHRMAVLPSPMIKAMNLRPHGGEGGARVAQLEAHWDEQRQEARLADEMLLLLRLSVLGMEELPLLALALEGQPVSGEAEARAWERLGALCAEALSAEALPRHGEGGAAGSSIDVLDRSLRELAEATQRLARRQLTAE